MYNLVLRKSSPEEQALAFVSYVDGTADFEVFGYSPLILRDAFTEVRRETIIELAFAVVEYCTGVTRLEMAGCGPTRESLTEAAHAARVLFVVLTTLAGVGDEQVGLEIRRVRRTVSEMREKARPYAEADDMFARRL